MIALTHRMFLIVFFCRVVPQQNARSFTFRSSNLSTCHGRRPSRPTFSHRIGNPESMDHPKDQTIFWLVLDSQGLENFHKMIFGRLFSLLLILLMLQKSHSQPPGIYLKPWKEWDKLLTSTGDRRFFSINRCRTG